MIQEIINFVTDLEANNSNIHNEGVALSEGLYLFVKIEVDGHISIVETFPYYDVTVEKKKISKESIAEINQSLYQRCLSLQQVLKPVAQTKIFNPIEKIFGATCSAFALGFNKKNLIKNDNEKIKRGITQYFDKAKEFINVDDKDLEDQFKTWHNTFYEYCKHNLMNFLSSLKEYKEGKDDLMVFILLNEPTLKHYQIIYDNYFMRNVFNKDEYSLPDEQGIIHGVPDSLYTYNGKKPFLQHQSAPINLKYRTLPETAKLIWQFYQLQKRVLPNPLPVFIDKDELNREVVGMFNEDKKLSYTNIIKTLFEKYQTDLGSYYLLFFQKGEIIDLDFVPSFQYHLSNCELRQTDCLNGNYTTKDNQKVSWALLGRVDNIFEFQNKVANRILGMEMETDTKEGKKWLKYFGEIEYNPKYMTAIQYNLFLKYRLSFYNYIYKSQRKAIDSNMFHDIMRNTILDDLRHDEVKDNKHSKQYDIKQRILIWFSLYHFFEQNKNTDMINLTQHLFNKLKAYANSDSEIGDNLEPELFAFSAGQVIREILQKSKSENRSHDLLEPFLQKSDVNLFKLAIAKAFETYKHEFTLYSGSKRYSFDKVMSLVMGATDSNLNIKDLLPFTLAGYFADSVFTKEKENSNQTK